jgi:hypothetical protein
VYSGVIQNTLYFEVPLSKGHKEKKEKHIRTITTCKVHGVEDKSFIVDGFKPFAKGKIVCIGCNQKKYLNTLASA